MLLTSNKWSHSKRYFPVGFSFWDGWFLACDASYLFARQMTPSTQSLGEGGGKRRWAVGGGRLVGVFWVLWVGNVLAVVVVAIAAGINLTLSPLPWVECIRCLRVRVSCSMFPAPCSLFVSFVLRPCARMCAEIYNWERHLKHIRMEIAAPALTYLLWLMCRHEIATDKIW